MEKMILKFKLPMIENLSLVSSLVTVGYKETGNKFRVSFNGSKGYLSNIEISCEGVQKERNNIIYVENLRTKKGLLQSKIISVFYSQDAGVRIQID